MGPKGRTGEALTNVTGYRTDLAYIHDVGFGSFAADAAPGLLRLLRRAGKRRGLVVDLGCGRGIWAKQLIAAGYSVLGVDQSRPMIDIARVPVPSATFRVGSFVSTDLPHCVAVTAIGEIFSYLFDHASTPRRLARLFRRIHAVLERGGGLVFDVAASGRVPGGGPDRVYREGRDWTMLREADEDRRRGILTRRITVFRRVGRLYRRDHEVHRLRLYDPSAVAAWLERAGFRVGRLHGYGRMRFVKGVTGFAARKSTAEKGR